MLYYWKLLMFDGSGNILGDIEDYEVMGNFRIMPIHSLTPSNGGTNIPLNQKFTWVGPLSVPSYEFWLSDIYDPEVESPKIIMNITGSNSIDYPENGDFPLENETSYYWKIVPKDINNNFGLPSSHSMVYQFTTKLCDEVDGESQECGCNTGIAEGTCDCEGNTPADLYGSDNYDCDGMELSLFNGLIPEDFSIHSIYPNPFNPITNITYGIPEYTNVQIIVYDLSGKQVETLINEFQTAGYHSVNWNADNLPNGVYLIRMDSGEFSQRQKVVLVK
jgi:hypothetical protein